MSPHYGLHDSHFQLKYLAVAADNDADVEAVHDLETLNDGAHCHEGGDGENDIDWDCCDCEITVAPDTFQLPGRDKRLDVRLLQRSLSDNYDCRVNKDGSELEMVESYPLTSHSDDDSIHSQHQRVGVDEFENSLSKSS